jgi:hypothetical protein
MKWKRQTKKLQAAASEKSKGFNYGPTTTLKKSGVFLRIQLNLQVI